MVLFQLIIQTQCPISPAGQFDDREEGRLKATNTNQSRPWTLETQPAVGCSAKPRKCAVYGTAERLKRWYTRTDTEDRRRRHHRHQAITVNSTTSRRRRPPPAQIRKRQVRQIAWCVAWMRRTGYQGWSRLGHSPCLSGHTLSRACWGRCRCCCRCWSSQTLQM